MRNLKTIFLMLLLFPEAHSQGVLTLGDCYDRARKNYPVIRQRELIEKTKSLSLENASRGSLPQVGFGGQATYQSEVTQIPIEMPGIEPLNKDQYRIFGEISQTLYHGGLVDQQKASAEVDANVEQQNIEVEMYQIRSRINELYFGILLLQEQASQTELVRLDLTAALKKTEAAIVNGTALKTAADVLRAELLRVDQRLIEMESSQSAYRDVLTLFIDQAIDDKTQLEKPSFSLRSASIDRPELRLLEGKKKSLEANYHLRFARKKPRVELFVQGGYGRPGLNMLENSFSLYGLGGLRFSWLLSGYYTSRNEKEIFTLQQQAIDVQKETFLFNTRVAVMQHAREIDRFRRLMDVDDQIISLRRNIRETAAIQLEEGVITATDFIQEVNAEDQAKQNRVLHEIQWLLAQARYQFSSGHNQ